ncbi:MAG: aminotransferase class I/II-fold pyridoxal phosphate-dependent enzyme [Lachnospiraceae bacterium]
MKESVRDHFSNALYTQDDMPLCTALDRFCKKDIIPFDVPGHKRGKGNPELVDLLGEKTISKDINSLAEMDNLNHANGVILASEELMAQAYGAEHAFFTVNGTTLGIHVMILSACNPGDKILLPRNIHKSAMNALILGGLNPVYMEAEVSEQFGFVTGVTLDTVRKSMDENPDAKAVFIINPTYYGVCSQLKEIIAYAHSKGIAVLCDEAHGSHFTFHDELPFSGMQLGADMAATSVHKTGGAMTQASALLLNSNYISKDRVNELLGMFHTTSPSYILMASLDAARHNLATRGKELFDQILPLVRSARITIDNIPGLFCLSKNHIGEPGIYDFDETKLTINVTGLGITGFEVYDLLFSDYGIQLELADVYNILAIVSLGDDQSSLDGLVTALTDLSKRFFGKKEKIETYPIPLKNPTLITNPRAAYYGEKEFVPIDSCVGRTIAEAIMVYPPGIPILAPGECVSQEIIDYLKMLKTMDSKFTDLHDETLETMLVLKK